MEIANRLKGLSLSPIRIVTENAPPDAIPLGIGEPAWDLPEPARKVLAELSGSCPYSPGVGLPELRKAIAAHYEVDSEEVFVTCGAVGALFALIMAWVDPQETVLIPDPGYPTYRNVVLFAGAQPLPYPLDKNNRFRLDANTLLPYLERPKVKAIIINNPSNPTGGCITGDALRQIADACRERNILLIADEVYLDLYFDKRIPSLREVSSYGVVVSSISKGWGAPGLRVGWAVGAPKWLEPAKVAHSYAVTCVTTPAQYAAVALLEASQEVLADARRILNSRWQALRQALQHHLDMEASPPDGTFYHWMPLPEKAQADPMAFCLRLRDEAKVTIVPGLAFGEQGRPYIRISFAAAPELLEEGLRRLAPYWK
jgi:aspartate/methionine/tyrosine aminotransferase